METTGTFAFQVKDGAIQGVEFAVTRSGSFGERSFERTTTTKFSFSKIGETAYEVPADALALLAERAMAAGFGRGEAEGDPSGALDGVAVKVGVAGVDEPAIAGADDDGGVAARVAVHGEEADVGVEAAQPWMAGRPRQVSPSSS